MRLILIGPPGSGKGTQSKLLCDRFGLVQVGTGDILREAIRIGTPVGKQAEPFVNSGHLVPDALVNEIIRERFRRPDRPVNFVMDGYPRTTAQAAAFDAILAEQGLDLNAALFFVTDEEIVVRRAFNRQRGDDDEATIRSRIRIYRQINLDLKPYYQARGLYREIIGEGTVEEVHARILQAINA